jgi:hypothetical protein
MWLLIVQYLSNELVKVIAPRCLPNNLFGFVITNQISAGLFCLIHRDIGPTDDFIGTDLVVEE